MCRLHLLLLLGAFLSAHPVRTQAQVLADPVLRGQTFVGDSALRSGTVVLHRVWTEGQGEVDSVAIARDGTFTMRLPSVPDPGRSDVYFASVRHAGILYFGAPLTLAVQLDSVYAIHAYDTLLVEPSGREVPVESRSLFLEPGADGGWQITDLFQLRNDERRTLVARDDGVVWQYPLPAGALDPTVAQSEFASGAAEVRDGVLVVNAPIPPGERMYVVRYRLPTPFLDLPLPALTETLDILIKEPAPPISIPALEAAERVELEPGTTFRRFTGTDLSGRVVRILEGRESKPPPVEWFAVALGMLLAGVGAWAVQSGRTARPQTIPVDGRQQIVLQIALLDEAFQARTAPSAEERGAYEARRRDLMRRLRAASG